MERKIEVFKISTKAKSYSSSSSVVWGAYKSNIFTDSDELMLVASQKTDMDLHTQDR